MKEQKEWIQPDEFGDTRLHFHAGTGSLCEVPHELLTVENLTLRNRWGRTPLHQAFRNYPEGHRDDILHFSESAMEIFTEVGLFTEQNLTMADCCGDTPLHFAAELGLLTKLPQEILTEENLTLPNEKGNTALHRAAKYGNLDQIPKYILLSSCAFVLNKEGTRHYI